MSSNKRTTVAKTNDLGSQLQHYIWSALYVEESLGYEFTMPLVTDFSDNSYNVVNYYDIIMNNTQLYTLFPYDNDYDNITKINEETMYDTINNAVDLFASSQTMIDIKQNFITYNISRIQQLVLNTYKKDLGEFPYSQWSHIVVHIDRTDNDMPDYNIDVEFNYYYNLLVSIIDSINIERKLVIHLVSNIEFKETIIFSRLINKYKETRNAEIVMKIHLNLDVLNTLYILIGGSYLIMSPTTLSYIAGWLTNGFVYYHPFWYNPLSSWIVSDVPAKQRIT